MREIEYCMRYDTCKRCPLQRKCELELKLLDKQKDDRKERKEKRNIKRGYYAKDL